jgi:AcrR family transcriptional regulator
VFGAALRVFLAFGFHATTTEALEDAVGMSWTELCAVYGDKEGLFLAAVEHRLNTPEAIGADEMAAIGAMLRRVPSQGASAMLRAQHREALRRLTQMADSARDA